MYLHELAPAPGSKKSRVRVGRGLGSGLGKTSGKGQKGQKSGAVVDPVSLIEEGIVKNVRDGIRILGNGELTKKLTVKACGFSKTAEEKIVAAGGKVEVI